MCLSVKAGRAGGPSRFTVRGATGKARGFAATGTGPALSFDDASGRTARHLAEAPPGQGTQAQPLLPLALPRAGRQASERQEAQGQDPQALARARYRVSRPRDKGYETSMSKLGAVLCVLSALIVPAAAQAAQPPPGADISPNLDYVERVPSSDMIVEGKLDKVRGNQVLLTTGRYGFKTYDVSDPRAPEGAWTPSSPTASWARTATGRTRTWSSTSAASSSSARSTRATTTWTRPAARASARRAPRTGCRAVAAAST